jgi:DNA-binding response OmpR family regulator
VANIYVIDDDDQLLRMVGLMLERGGHSPTLINNPAKGLDKIKSEKPDLLVLDVMMPNMSGHDVCRQIRADKDLADLPVLILTARAQEVDRVAALKSGADDYLSKPVTSQELIQKVDDLLTRKRSGGPTKEGVVVSFMGMRGGVGRTTLAVNLAGALRRISQEEVCLVEFSPSGGQVVMHLRLQAKNSWAGLPPAEALDWDTLKKHLTIHPTGMRVLTSPPLPFPPNQPPADIVTKILQLLRENSVAVVVDLPAVLNPAVTATLSASDMVLHVVTPEVISVQLAVQANRALTTSGINIKQRSHILNNIWAEGQLPANAVERGLGARLAFQIGYDSSQARALAQGVPLTLTSAQSPLSVTVNRIAEAILQRVGQEAT